MTTIDHDDDTAAPVIRIWPRSQDRRTPAIRLGAAVSGRVGPETLPALIERDRIAAAVGMDGLPGAKPERVAALLETARDVRRGVVVGEDVLPAEMPPSTPPLRLIVVAIAVLAAFVAMTLLAPGDDAHAATWPTLPAAARPVVVLTVSGPTLTVRVPVPGASVAAWMQTTTGAVRLPVRRGYTAAVLASALVRPGESVIELDQIGGGVVRIPVTTRRQSRVSAPMLDTWGGLTLVRGIASHYDAVTGGYRGDVASPVQVQVLSGWDGRWTTVATLTTDATGTVAGVVALPAGPALVRLVRPVGSTVTGGTGAAVLAQDVPCRSARGDLVC